MNNDEMLAEFAENVARMAFAEEVIELAQRAQVRLLKNEKLSFLDREALILCVKYHHTSWMHDTVLVRFSRP